MATLAPGLASSLRATPEPTKWLYLAFSTSQSAELRRELALTFRIVEGESE